MQTTNPNSEALAPAVAALRALREHLDETLQAVRWNATTHADIDTLGFSLLVTSETAAVELLADNDVAFAIPAGAAARAAWEAAVNAAWMVAPNGPAERDRRWLALMLSERAFWQHVKTDFEALGRGSEAVAAADAEVARLDAIIGAATPQLRAAGVKDPAQLPDFRQRLSALGKERQHFMWRQASQFVHPGSRALEQVRSLREHGSESATATFSWRSDPSHWALTIGLAGEALMLCGETLGSRMTPPGTLSPEGMAAWRELARIVGTLGKTWPGH